MKATYLYLNSLIYILLAAWCIALPEKTSNSLGFQLINSSGNSEYFVVYGALQIGLAAFFAYTAYKADRHMTGLIFSLCMYIPIFIFRMISFYRFEGIGPTTIGTACLEIILTSLALFLYFKK